MTRPFKWDASSGWRWHPVHSVISSDPVPGSLQAEGLDSLRELCEWGWLTWAITLQGPVGTGFIQLWSGLPAPGKPCLGHGVSSDMGVGAVSLGLSQL